ncbi:MAG TPA: histidine kinase [Puia sp.]|nr:histidine kinase [Puia sp.]
MIRVSRLYKILFHCVIWSALVSCVLVLGPRAPDRAMGWTSVQVLWSVVPCIGLFYAHAYWLMPYYLFQRRKLMYWSLLILLGVAVSFLSGLAFYYNTHAAGHTYNQAVLRRTAPVLLFMLASACVGAFGENARLEKERKEKETEHLRTELSFLRGQVNPHFMLNVLNSMVLMARKRSELLEPALLELAGLMNYIIYEADHEKIRLEDELEYLRVYIDLQMLRFKDDVSVQFNIPGCVGDQRIEPMLLIPMVENAFKHGIGLVEAPVIHIDVRITEENVLSVTVKNKFRSVLEPEEKCPPGIGLSNLRKRLDLIYPGTHRLDMTKEYRNEDAQSENWFYISLNIPL